MEYKFVNAQHEETYHGAKRLLASEDERQAAEAKRLREEWQRYPERERLEREAWLRQHFHACREPYIKLLIEVVSLGSPTMVVPIGPEQIGKGENVDL